MGLCDDNLDGDNGITWRVHPARERPGAACFAVGVIAVLAWLSATLMQNPWWAGLAAVVMVTALGRFFFPSEFRVDAEGVTARSPWKRRRYRWREVRRFLYDERGGYLSTRARGSVIDSFRGMHLMFGGSLTEEQRGTVINRIRQAIKTEERQPCSG